MSEVIYYTSFTPKTIVDSFAKFDRYRYQRSGLGDPNTIKCCMDSRRFGTFTPTDLWYDCLFRTYTLKKMDALPKLLKHTNSARVSYPGIPIIRPKSGTQNRRKMSSRLPGPTTNKLFQKAHGQFWWEPVVANFIPREPGLWLFFRQNMTRGCRWKASC